MAAALAAGTSLMFGIVYWLGTHALFQIADKAVLEQLDLLAARPPELLPFMITSRMHDRRENPHVITAVGLFGRDRRPIVGNIRAIPAALTLDGRIRTLPEPAAAGPAPERERIAGRVLPDGRILVVARNIEDLLTLRDGILRALLLALAPAILLSLAGGAIVSRRTRKRLARLRRSAERIIAGRLEERLPVRMPGDELDQLAAIVNRMLDRLAEVVMALKGAGEDIAHDIRTPLTAVRARLERGRWHAASRDELLPILDRSIAGLDQALATVSALLRIAEIEHTRRHAGFAALDLAEVVRDAADAYAPVAEDNGVALIVDAGRPAAIVGDRALMLELVLNLVDNALKFTPAGGEVRVSLDGTPQRPLLRIADNGPGIPESERALVCRRFYRADRSRRTSGTGLGLSLVGAIAGLHGFRLALGDNRPGCVVEIECWKCPVAAAPAELAEA